MTGKEFEHHHTARFGAPVSGSRSGSPHGDIRHVPGMASSAAVLAASGFRPIGGGAPKKEEPPEIGTLDDAALQAALDAQIAAFEALSASDSITEAELASMREITTGIEAIRAEQTTRRESAEAAQHEIEEMAKTVRGPDPAVVEEPPAEDPPAEDPPAEDPPAEDPPVVESIAASNRPLNLGQIRSRQRKVVEPTPDRHLPVITAAAELKGSDAGRVLSMDELTEAVTSRANALKGNRALNVASYAIPFDERLVCDSDSYAEGMSVLTAAADQSRLPGGDLVASGGWCAPSETVYDIADIACPDMLWGPPEVQLRRGGLRFFVTPTLTVDDLAHEWTETMDEDAIEDELTKECFKVPCPEPEEVRCAAVYACVEAGILTERAFPELVGWYTRNAMVAHEIVLKRNMFLAAVNHARTKQITVDATFAAFSAVFAAVGLQAVDIIEKHSLCDRIGLEVVFPFWAKNLFLADLARRNGLTLDEIDPTAITNAFGRLGVSVSFARGLTPNVPTNIGGSTVPLGWPDSVPFLIHPAGGFQIGRGPVIDLGVVQDSAKFATNDYTALWTEECVALIARGPEARFVTVPVCPDGVTGAQDPDIDCSSPIDGGPDDAS